jgi:propionyl-CoA carboxylase beta chain
MHDILVQLEEKRAEPHASAAGRSASTPSTPKGKLTARERLDVLLDRGLRSRNTTCSSTHRCAGVRHGKDHHPGRWRRHRLRHRSTAGWSIVFSQDFTVFGGCAVSETHAEKICKIMDQAV